VSIFFQNEKRLPQARLTIVSYVIVGLVALLLFGFWKLQIIDSDRYAQMAERNRVRSIPIIAPRGVMLDREGRILVDNYPSFSVLLLRDAPSQLEKYLPQIAEGLGMTLDDLRQQIDDAKDMPKFQPIVIKPEASPADIAFIESHRADIPVLEMLMVYRRRYPREGFFAHVSGYVGEVSPEDVEASDSKLRPGDIVGKTGLEKEYNDTLMGADGLRRVIVNSVGKEMGRLEQQDAIPGKPIPLTIDYDLQVAAEQGLGNRQGAVVALDPRNGEVLAMASRPTYNPNDFAIRISRDEWQQLDNDPDKPLLNRAIQAQLAPGSVFKIIMASAMLESKALPENYTVFCAGQVTFYGHVFHDLEKHGEVDLHQAIVHSCDVYFYNVGKELGIDRIAFYATSEGLGKRTGIDLPGEETGLIPSQDWVQRVFHRKWYAGETISVAIGQGAVTTTPLQLARTIGGIAMGGIFKQPHLLKTDKPVPEVDFRLQESTVEQITQAMYGVVNEGGTAGGIRTPGIELCGKTGSAQIVSNETFHRASNATGIKGSAWFVGFAPRRNPEIVVAVLVEDTKQHGSAAAAPLVRDVIKAYYDKNNAKSNPRYTADGKPIEPPAEPGPVPMLAAVKAPSEAKAGRPAAPAAIPAKPKVNQPFE